MALPALRVAGTRVDGTTASLTPSYPAGIQAGDLILLHAFFHEGTTTTTGSWNTPTGFSLVRKQNVTVSAAKKGELAVFARRATGSESGTVTVSRTGGTGNATVSTANMTVWSGVAGSTDTDGYEGVTGVTDETPPYTMSVVTTGADRLVVAWVFANDNVAATGTSTNWTDVIAPYTDPTGPDYAGHTASFEQATAGTVNGSWSQSAGIEGALVGLALIGIATQNLLRTASDTVAIGSDSVLGTKQSGPIIRTATDSIVASGGGAIAHVAARGSMESTTAATTHSLTITDPTNIAVGNHLTLRWSAYWQSGYSLASVTDSRGNTWQIDRQANNGVSLHGGVASCKVATAYQAGDTITLNWNAHSDTNVSAGLDEWSGLAASSWAAAATHGVSNASTSFDSTSAGTGTSGQLLLGSLSTFGTQGTVTPTTRTPPWTALSTVGGTANRHVGGHYRVLSAADAQQYDGSLSVSRDKVAFVVAYAAGAGGASDLVVATKSSPAGITRTATDTITVSAPLVTDTFTRTRTTDWGSPDAGGEWHESHASDFSVEGTYGRMAWPTAVVARNVVLRAQAHGAPSAPSGYALDTSKVFRFRWSRGIDGANAHNVDVYARRNDSVTDGANFYRATVQCLPSGAMRAELQKVVAGTTTDLTGGTWTTLTPTFSANAWYWVRFEVFGSSPTTIRLRVWIDGNPEPSTWDISMTHTESALDVAGGPGFRAFPATTQTTFPVYLDFDDLTTTNLAAAAADTVTATKNAGGAAVSRTAADTVAIGADTVNRMVAVRRTAADTIAIGVDSVARVLARTRTATDTSSIGADAAARIVGVRRTTTDTIALVGDAVAAVVGVWRTATDTNAIGADTVTPVSARTRTATDTVVIGADAVARVVAMPRTATDTNAIGVDEATRLTGKLRTATDTNAIGADSVTRASVQARTATDTTSLSETAARVVVAVRSATDTSAIGADTVARVLGSIRTASDTAAIGADAIASVLAATRQAVDSVTTSDEIAHQVNLGQQNVTRTASDTTALTEAVDRIVGQLRTLTDSVAVSGGGQSGERLAPDGLLEQSNLTGNLAAVQDDPDSPDASWLTAVSNNAASIARTSFPTPSAALAGSQEFRALVRKMGGTGTPTARIELYASGVLVRAGANQNVTGSAVLSFSWDASEVADAANVECRVVGTQSGGATNVRATVEVGAVEWNATVEVGVAQDSVAHVLGRHRVATDTVSTSDDISRLLVAVRTATDAVSTTEAVGRLVVAARTATDTTTVTDEIARAGTFLRTLFDTTTVTDSVGRAGAALTRTATDSTTVTETALRIVGVRRTATDTTSLTDAVTRAGAFARAATDTTSITEAAVRIVGLRRSATDTTTVSDSVARVGAFTRAAVDSTSLTESVIRLVGLRRAAADTTTTGDTVTRVSVQARTLADTTSLTETVARVVGLRRATADTTSVADAVARQFTGTRHLTDTTSVSDFVERSGGGLIRAATDTVSTSDSIIRLVTAARVATDSSVTSDAVMRLVAAVRAAQDTLTTTDSVTGTISYGSVSVFRTATDTTTVSDAVARLLVTTRTLADATSTLDAITRRVDGRRTAEDSTATSDGIVRRVDTYRDLVDLLITSDELLANVGLRRSVIDSLLTADELAVHQMLLRAAVDWTEVSDVLVQVLPTRKGKVDSRHSARNTVIGGIRVKPAITSARRHATKVDGDTW